MSFKQDDLLSAEDNTKQLTGPFPFVSIVNFNLCSAMPANRSPSHAMVFI